jgi:hypothetical protein
VPGKVAERGRPDHDLGQLNVSALNDLETAASPLVSIDRRITELVRACASALDRASVLRMVVEMQTAVIWRILDEAPTDDELTEIARRIDDLLGLLDGESAAEATIRQTLAQLDARSPDALDAFALRLQRHEVGNPSGDQRYFSTDRRPRRRWTREGTTKTLTTEVFAPDGSPLGRDPKKMWE